MAHYRAVAQAAAPTQERIGVLVVNLGTPDSPGYLPVMRYLREFLSDRRVVETSPLIWWPILYGFVLPLRPIRTGHNYRRIWMPEGSPLALYTRRLADKLQARLGDDSMRVALGMTYGNPSIASALEVLMTAGARRLLVLPLYPQYCAATTGSAFDRTTAALRRWRWLPETRFVNDYHRDGAYVAALAARIEEHWHAQGARSHLLFSYHGIPAAYVSRGDPYQAQAEATTRAVVARLKLDADGYSHCYQSRFGRVEWLKPYTEETIVALARRGMQQLTVVSPSFAVDCLETLEEIAIGYRDTFRAEGGKELTLVPALNDDDRHAALLADVVRRHAAGWL